MIRSAWRWLPVTLLAFVVFQGFQCGSPEFTGAKVQMQQKNYKEAIHLLELEVKKNPQNEEAWYFLGGLKGDEGDYRGMNEAFDNALKISSLHAKEIYNIRYSKWGQHLNSGVNYLERASSDSAQFFEMSIREFDSAIEALPDTGLTYRYLGYAFYNKGELDGAAKAFQKAWDMGKDAESVKRLGRIHIVKGNELKNRFEASNAEDLKAVKAIEEVKKTTRKSDILRVLGAPDKVRKGPRGTKKENWDYASYNLTLSVDGEKVVGKTFTKPFNPKVDSTSYFAALKQYNQAIEALEKAKNADPSDNEILTMMLSAYVESNRVAEAAKEFRQALKNDPTNATNHYIMGVLHRTMGDFDAAVDEFKEAYRLDSTNVEALFDIGATYYNWGVDLIRLAEDKDEESDAFKAKFHAALPFMEKVASVKEGDAQVWETLGTIYARLNMKDKALKAFEKADKIRQGK